MADRKQLTARQERLVFMVETAAVEILIRTNRGYQSVPRREAASRAGEDAIVPPRDGEIKGVIGRSWMLEWGPRAETIGRALCRGQHDERCWNVDRWWANPELRLGLELRPRSNAIAGGYGCACIILLNISS